MNKKEMTWNLFINRMIDMNIGETIIYEHMSYRIVVKKEKPQYNGKTMERKKKANRRTIGRMYQFCL